MVVVPCKEVLSRFSAVRSLIVHVFFGHLVITKVVPEFILVRSSSDVVLSVCLHGNSVEFRDLLGRFIYLLSAM